MKRLLLHACHEVAKRDEKRLSESEYKAVQKRYRTILTQGERELPPIPPRQKGQRGKVAKSDAHNLWERMKKYEKAVLRFAKHPDVAFTNNRAERDLLVGNIGSGGRQRQAPGRGTGTTQSSSAPISQIQFTRAVRRIAALLRSRLQRS